MRLQTNNLQKITSGNNTKTMNIYDIDKESHFVGGAKPLYSTNPECQIGVKIWVCMSCHYLKKIRLGLTI